MGWDGPLTERQFNTWNEWLDMQWESPTSTEYYLMRLMMEVKLANPNLKKGTSVSMKEFMLPFGKTKRVIDTSSNIQEEKEEETEARQIHKQNVAEISKQVWAMRIGVPVDEFKKNLTPPKEEPPIQQE